MKRAEGELTFCFTSCVGVCQGDEQSTLSYRQLLSCLAMLYTTQRAEKGSNIGLGSNAHATPIKNPRPDQKNSIYNSAGGGKQMQSQFIGEQPQTQLEPDNTADLLLTTSLAQEEGLLNDARRFSGDAPHFLRKPTLPLPTPPVDARSPAPRVDLLVAIRTDTWGWDGFGRCGMRVRLREQEGVSPCGVGMAEPMSDECSELAVERCSWT